MKRSVLPVIAVIALVLVAGCQTGPGSSGTPTATDEAPTTDASTPGANESGDLPAWGNETSIDYVALVDAHRQALSNGSGYSYRLTSNWSRAEGSPEPAKWSDNVTIQWTFDTESMAAVRTANGPEHRVQSYASGDGNYTRIWNADSSSWSYDNASGLNETVLQQKMWEQTTRSQAWGVQYREILGGFDFEFVETVDRDGTTLYKYEDTSANVSFGWQKSMDSSSATLLASEDGVIHEVDLRYSGTIASAESGGSVDVTITRTHEFFDVNSTSVSQPSWAGNASSGE